MQRMNVREREKKGGGRRRRTWVGGCRRVKTNQWYLTLNALNNRIVVMFNSKLLGKGAWESQDLERVETRGSWNSNLV